MSSGMVSFEDLKTRQIKIRRVGEVCFKNKSDVNSIVLRNLIIINIINLKKNLDTNCRKKL